MQTIHISQAIPGALQKSDALVPEVLVKLTPSETAIVSASVATEKNVRIVDMDADMLISFAQQIRREIVLRLGLNTQGEEDEADLVAGISKAIFKHKILTKREVQNAIDKALDGDYLNQGQTFVHFTLTNFSMWIKAYISETKAPVMKKHAQFIHQQEKPKPIPTTEERRKGAIELVNTYLDARKKDPDHRVTAAAELFKELEEFGISSVSADEKREIWAGIEKTITGSKEVKQVIARNVAYNRFIDSLIDFGYRLGEDGRPVEDNE